MMSTQTVSLIVAIYLFILEISGVMTFSSYSNEVSYITPYSRKIRISKFNLPGGYLQFQILSFYVCHRFSKNSSQVSKNFMFCVLIV